MHTLHSIYVREELVINVTCFNYLFSTTNNNFIDRKLKQYLLITCENLLSCHQKKTSFQMHFSVFCYHIRNLLTCFHVTMRSKLTAVQAKLPTTSDEKRLTWIKQVWLELMVGTSWFLTSDKAYFTGYALVMYVDEVIISDRCSFCEYSWPPMSKEDSRFRVDVCRSRSGFSHY